MSIAKRVAETIDKHSAGDPEGAFVPACIAVDATAKQERQAQKTGERYRGFIEDYLWLIGLVGLRGIVSRRIHLDNLHPDLRPDADGTVGIESILYTVVRCGLLHDATIADYVSLSPTTMLGSDGKKYILADTLPLGLVAAVIASPTNSSARIGRNYWIQIGKQRFVVDDIWGRRDMIMALLAARAL